MKYVMFFQPRSGSTYIASRLNALTAGLVNGFEVIDRNTAKELELIAPSEYERYTPEVKREVMARFFRKFSAVPVRGFKVAPYQIWDDVAGFFQRSLQESDRLIFLYRQNPVQTAISQIWALHRARQNRPAWLERGEIDSVGALSIERSLLEWYIVSSVLERDVVLSLSALAQQRPRVCLSYEEFFADQVAGMAKIKAFLGISEPVVLPESSLVKVRAAHPSGHIKNLGEVKGWLRELGFEERLLAE